MAKGETMELFWIERADGRRVSHYTEELELLLAAARRRCLARSERHVIRRKSDNKVVARAQVGVHSKEG